MDKNVLKSFAIRGRQKMINGIMKRAQQLGVTKDEIKKMKLSENGFILDEKDNNIVLKQYQFKQRQQLVGRIKEKGFEEVIEEAAYIWFNGLIALRFMEVKGYLPTGVRVLSSIEEGKKEPDIIRAALHIDLDLNREIVTSLIKEKDIEDLYRYLLVRQCNQLGKIIPTIFQRIRGYIELLLPDDLLARGSIIDDLVFSVKEEAFREGIEVIGWLYQYYISQEKDEVFAGVNKNQKIMKENIPAATQIFTPKWIVQYMVENSLGKLWRDINPDTKLISKWRYYLDEGHQGIEVKQQRYAPGNKKLTPEDIKLLDPAMGSGHILVYAFDLLYDIYLEAGYREEDISKLILEKNLYGLDIDDKVTPLTSFALMMQARSKTPDIFDKKVSLNIYAIQESIDISQEAMDFFIAPQKDLKDEVQYLMDIFQNAKEYGAMLEVKKINFDAIEGRIEEIREADIEDLFMLEYREAILKTIPPLVKQGRLMSDKYDVVVANPPYGGLRKLNPNLKRFLEDNYKDYKYDLFSVFIIRNLSFTKEYGYTGFMTPNVWQFINSYEKLRRVIMNNYQLDSLIQLEDEGFQDASVSISTFIINKCPLFKKAIFIKLQARGDVQAQRAEEAIKSKDGNKYVVEPTIFNDIPNHKIAFWISSSTLDTFKRGEKLETIGKPRQGMATSDNNRFLKYWYEVSFPTIKFGATSSNDTAGYKWIPYNKGGGHRKWYGNNDMVINWEKNGYEVKKYAAQLYGNYSRTIKNEGLYFKEGITYTFIGKDMAPRLSPKGFIFDVAGSMIFVEEEWIFYILALISTNLSRHYMDILNPTINIQVGDIKNIPVIKTEDRKTLEKINRLALENIDIAKKHWDSFETSWDFEKHPFLIHRHNTCYIKEAYNQWESFTENQFNRLKANEEVLNKMFIEIYGLQDVLTPEVEEKEITIKKANRERDIKSLISYAVGCMFGRYSLDADGLVYGGGDFNINQYKSLQASKNNIVPIVENESFEGDITNRFEAFLIATFGQEAIEGNLTYIAETLGMKSNETSRQTIKRYFQKYFYKDHIKTYNKRPIYWLFNSKDTCDFKVLTYIHRHNELMMSIENRELRIDIDDGILTNYRGLQGKEVNLGQGKYLLAAIE
ncbi:BREX-1 system adenine-specific DNA-methyltransferase PglX [Natronincola ferrireducens]|uniref:site-specific DNA-methyltransferase (adenine-specific) n=1 Tax=Natronincola ferrireducens TaxID=393762 RepID=A0A1G9BJK1_9FIRM|nr:BREX-1 system adenine-specific DNA-methyltransferase PglX [Natronincola ferrireducens]SDK39637.1 Methyltransferase domain-containing protein [Natronincola ferrireducens]